MARVVWNTKAATAFLDKAEKSLVAIGFQLERDIKVSISGPGPSAPGSPPGVDTGRLRASISTNWSGAGGRADEDKVGVPKKESGRFRVVVGTNLFYAPLLEFGTRRMAARPFIRPAFDRMKSRIASMLAKGTT